TYDHRIKIIGLPVRSALHKLDTGGLVVAWVTSSESLLLYVFAVFLNVWVERVGRHWSSSNSILPYQVTDGTRIGHRGRDLKKRMIWSDDSGYLS
ncbi:hypothetical protein BCR34DRAFT_482058, partial [Clohesyomyces aquaticus]